MDSHQDEVLSFPLDIVSKLPGDLGYIPISVEIDFGAKIAEVKEQKSTSSKRPSSTVLRKLKKLKQISSQKS